MYDNQNYSGYQQTPPPNSNMALISLIAGILGLTFVPTLGSIVALITGYMARKEINNSGGTVGGGGMATAGIVLGFIGVGIACCAVIFFLLVFFGILGSAFMIPTQNSLPIHLFVM